MRIFNSSLKFGISISFLCLFITVAYGQSSENSPTRSNAFFGSGFFISDDGFVITTNHIIEGAKKVFIKTRDRDVWLQASVIKVDAANDLALLRIPKKSTGLSLAHWDEVPLGLEVYVIGYPLGNAQGYGVRITEGIISGDQGVGARQNELFQLSAQTQRGNSGGPVFSPDGRVVGVVQSKIDAIKMLQKTNDFPQSINFALKSSVIEKFLAGMDVSYRAETINLGVRMRPYEAFRAKEKSVVRVMAFTTIAEVN